MNNTSIKNIVIFSESYPYGHAEVFLENEVHYLADYAEKIEIYPRKKLGTVRETPENVIINDLLSKTTFLDYLKQLFVNFFFLRYLSLFVTAQKRAKTPFFRSLRSFIGYCLDGFAMAEKLNKVQFPINAILYSYWYKHTALALALIHTNTKKIIRTHRGDLYEEEYSFPFHKFISEKINKIYSISKQGKDYLINHYNIKQDKIEVNYLGTYNNQKSCLPIKKNKVCIISCSALIERKRVGLIFDVIEHFAKANSDKEINWTHVGGGPLLEKMRSRSSTQKNLHVNFTGNLPNKDFHHLLCTNFYDVFLNLSTSEGIPVTIMEAISYGIPAIATDVGGTKEIVDASSGILLPENFKIEQAAMAIDGILEKGNNLRLSAKNFWDKNFNAQKNYSHFYQSISEL